MKLTLARSGWLALMAALATLAPIGTSFAATYTWTGTGSGNNWFSSATLLNSNWNSPASTLTSADTVVFGTSSKTTATINNNTAVTVTGLEFGAGAPAYTITGGNGGSNLTVTGSITNNSSNLQTITTSGGIGFGNGLVIDTGAAGISILRNSISPNTAGITKQGSGTLFWQNPVSYTGTITVAAGTFDGNNATFGGGFVNNGGAITNISTISLSYTQTAGTGTAGTLQGPANFSGGTFTAGNVTDTLTVSGGTVTAASLNDFTSLSGGVLQLSAGGFIAQTVTQTGGLLTHVSGTTGAEMGEGLIISSGTADVSLAKFIDNTGGTVNLFNNAAIAQSSTSSAVINVTGSVGSGAAFNGGLTLSNPGTVNLDLLKTGVSDNIAVNGGPLAYGGALALNLTDTGTATNYTEWQLFSPASTSGTLDSLTLASTTYGPMNFFIASTSTNPYDAAYGNAWLSNWSGGQRFIFNQTDGTLTVVPEPSTIVFAGIGAAMLGWHTWTRGRRKARMQLIEEHMRKVGEERGLA